MLAFRGMTISLELWGALICLSFFIFIMVGEDRKSERAHVLRMLIMNAIILLLSDAAAIYFRGNETELGYYAVRISNFVCFAAVCTVHIVAGRYLNAMLRSEGKEPVKAIRYFIYIPSALAFAYVTVSQFTGFMYVFDEHNRYQRASGIVIFAMISLLEMMVILVFITMNMKKMKRIKSVPLFIAFALVMAANIWQWLFYGVSMAYLALAIGMAILFFAYEREKVILYAEHRTMALSNELKIAQKEKELAETWTQLMLSQIQPHFLYNALAAISYLCTSDPDKARTTTDQFATYLRGNLHSLTSDNLVPFEQELRTTRAYLDIEKTRFGDDLEVRYEIEFSDFMMPTLTLQPIVENAVRHGICSKENGGFVTIRTEKGDEAVVITVLDNGNGFEYTDEIKNSQSHLGLRNVAERLELICRGTLKVHSILDVGTEIKILIPCDEAEEVENVKDNSC